MKKFNACLLAFLLALMLATSAHGDDLPPLNRPQLLMDAQSGEILSLQKPFLRWAPASLTKMLTAYTVFRAIELQQVAFNSPVIITKEANEQPPTRMGFPEGSILTVETALKIILVKSSNDVSYALGERIGGSEEGFVALMNAHARRLGMVDSNFSNAHGLPDENQYTSARDMAVLAFALTHEFPKYRRFFNIPALKYKNWRMRNHNALIERFEGTNGMKTGYVCASGSNLVARTKRKGRELIAVVFGGNSAKERNVRAAKLLTEGFAGEFPKSNETIKTLKRPDDLQLEPHDITVDICPFQHIAKAVPIYRPKDAPKAEDFIPKEDKNIVEAKASVSVSVGGATAISDDELLALDVPEDKPPTLLDFHDFYLTPRKKVGEDVIIKLGIPEPPKILEKIDDSQKMAGGEIPVPTKKPALD